MHVIATAGHVDHGKSALVRALTGIEPDRWEEERRRGLTIDLGFGWLTLPSGEQLAFVDVPGHERFVPNMLAGLGPVPAVLLVVAADGGWMPQSEEHLAAIDALGISRGLLAVTRSDLADPGPVLAAAARRVAATSLGKVAAVAVSAVTGQGLPELRAALGRLAASMPAPDPAAPVRLWVDRAFSIRGSGTVVTGTLPAGTVRAGDELAVTPSLQTVRVRGIQTLKEPASQVSGVARVALNLRGAGAGALARGMALAAPGRWALALAADVRLPEPAAAARPPREVTVHIGAARTTARVRQLAGRVARLSFAEPLPLHAGDRLLLRTPGARPGPAGGGARRPAGEGWEGRLPEGARPRWPVLAGATVLDPSPPPLSGRGAAAAAGRELASWPDPPDAASLLRRHGLLRAGALAAMGLAGQPPPVTGDWLADPQRWAELQARLAEAVAAHAAADPLAAGMTLEAARAALGLPDRRLVPPLAQPPLVITSGLLRHAPEAGRERAAGRAGGPGTAPGGEPAAGPAAGTGTAAAGTGTAARGQGAAGRGSAQQGSAPPGGEATRVGGAASRVGGAGPPAGTLPDEVAAAVERLLSDLAAAPFAAPEAPRLRELGLGPRAIAAAHRAGLLIRISDQIVLAPGAAAAAADALAGLPQPFTAAQARQALGTTRRVAIPLLEYLDRAGVTRRLPDDTRVLTASGDAAGRPGGTDR